jgi:hypothetical protein
VIFGVLDAAIFAGESLTPSETVGAAMVNAVRTSATWLTKAKGGRAFA